MSNFGHGAKNLASELHVSNLPAFEMHTAYDLVERRRQKDREVCVKRESMFRNL